MSHLDNGFRSLTLQRFPATDDVNPLQAWEAADEYLLQQLDDTETVSYTHLTLPTILLV